jgi:hypothetical protein
MSRVQVMYREKYGFTEPPKQLTDAFARVGIQYTVRREPLSSPPLTPSASAASAASRFLFPQNLDGMIGNTYDAHRMVALAQLQGKVSQFKEALWRM